MGFFNKIAGEEYTTLPETAPRPRPASRPGAIGYDAGLINALHGEHARLGATYEQIGKRAEAWEYDAVQEMLGQFRSMFQAHILTENVHLYAYLERAAGTNLDGVRRIHAYRRTMNDIAHQIVAFINTWRGNDFATPTARESFAADYRKVGPLLRQRIHSEEESLFPQYLPD